jgi:dihydroorotase
MKTLIYGGTIVNEGQAIKADIVVEDDRIAVVSGISHSSYDNTVDATGCFVLPGVIDTHVHFREPGLEEKADIQSESRAAAYGGVTSYCEMPNTVPQTTSLEALTDKYDRAARESYVNYSFFFGATNDNYTIFPQLDRHRIPGIKLFMGSSTGNMLVDKYGSLLKIFQTAAQVDLPVMTHCEDTDIVNQNMAQMKKAYGDDPPVALHPLIRSEEACFDSSALAAQLARIFGTQLHIAHISTAKELSLLTPYSSLLNPHSSIHTPHSTLHTPRITGEACVAHLLFTSADYTTKGALIKCNPAVKTESDREALRQALTDGRITTVATDHAPHLLSQKQGGCAKAASGMPMLQFSLVAMLELVSEGVLSIERLVELMMHHPAQLFQINKRGFLREGYKADIVIVRPDSPWTLTEDLIQSKCGWSPLTGQTFHWSVEHTFCNGHHIYNKGVFDESIRGEALTFR